MKTWRLGVRRALIDGEWVDGDVLVADGRIAEVGLPPRGDGLAVPGFVDLQVHGYGGVDLLCDDDDGAWRRAGAALLRDGVTAYLPTLITAAPRTTIDALRRTDRLAGDAGDGGDGARVLGAHLEGPFLSPERLDTHPPEHRREPNLGLLRELLAAGPVSMMTLAPERPGADALIAGLWAAGAVASVGHTAATADQTLRAIGSGASAVTHALNSMPGMSATEPGPAGFAIADRRMTVGVIADGVKVADELLTILYRAARERLWLVSDAIEAAGTTLRRARYGTTPVTLHDDGRVTDDAGVASGSVATIADGIRRLVALGIPLAAAVGAATRTPARLLRRTDVGSLTPGATADAVVLADDRHPIVTRVLRAGRPVEAAV